MVTVNNLKPLILRMLSNVSNPGNAKRKREEREAIDSFYRTPRRTEFDSASDKRSYKASLSQELRGRSAGADIITHRVKFVGLEHDAIMKTTQKFSRGQEFEDEFFRQFHGGVELPNLFLFGKKESVFREDYRLVRVRKRGNFPPLIDFIAYNDKYCFLVELKSQLSRKDNFSLDVGFRNWNQVDELLDPSDESRPEDPFLWRQMRNLQLLSSIVIKRYDILPLSTNAFQSHFAIFAIN